MKPLLSIVVPTKDRYKYLKKLILLIDSFNTDLIELIVQDNTENNHEILEFLDSKYKFIKYFHKIEQISISYNSDLAILNSTGEYVCFLGDDDGVTRHIIAVVEWMKEYGIEVVVPSELAYFWPDFVNSITGDISGSMSFKPFKFHAIPVNPQEKLLQIMRKGFINRGELPLVYHGIVKRETLEKIYSIGGSYFPGASPDIANGVALSLLNPKYFKLDFPIIISGASSSHGAGIRKMKKRAADLDELNFLPKNTKLNWEKQIPIIWTGETIWADSAIKALRYMKRTDLILKVNYEYLLSWFTCMNPSLWKMAFALTKNKFNFFAQCFYMILKRILFAIIRKITIKLFKYNDGQKIIKSVPDIVVAEQLIFTQYKEFRFNVK